jgi:hypothetical protein
VNVYILFFWKKEKNQKKTNMFNSKEERKEGRFRCGRSSYGLSALTACARLRLLSDTILRLDRVQKLETILPSFLSSFGYRFKGEDAM